MKVVPMIDDIKQIVMDAGPLAMKYFGRAAASRKADKSLVTEADLAIDEYIVGELTRRFPDSAILSEESGLVGNKDSRYVWAIDPIDGTNSFHLGLPVWSISLGLLRDQQPYLGCVYLPVLNICFFCTPETAFQDNRQLVANDSTFEEQDKFLAIPSNGHRKYQVSYPGKTRNLGSAAVHLCYVASGVATGCILQPSLWDIAGAFAILHKVGKGLFSLSGREITGRDFLESPKFRSQEPILACSRQDFDAIRPYITVPPSIRS
jgi:myo-inositol-1(or 4)-monophosphatase